MVTDPSVKTAKLFHLERFVIYIWYVTPDRTIIDTAKRYNYIQYTHTKLHINPYNLTFYKHIINCLNLLDDNNCSSYSLAS